MRFEYGVRNAGAANYVRTDTLKANGNLVAGYEIFDGLLRSRQKQDRRRGGRQRDHGHAVRLAWTASARPPALTTRRRYPDRRCGPPPRPARYPATRSTSTTAPSARRRRSTWSSSQEKWRTTTSYDGDNVTVVPPNGGTVTTTYKDARDRVTAVRQWHGRTATGSYDETRYGYTKRDEPAGDHRRGGQRLALRVRRAGQQDRTSDDPDAGISTMTYDDAGQLTSTTDARGRTIASVYDELGRRRRPTVGSAGGALLTKSVYDTLAKGALTSSTRYVDGKAYATGDHRLRRGRAAEGRVGDDPVRPGRGGVGEDLHDDLRLQAGRQHRVGGTRPRSATCRPRRSCTATPTSAWPDTLTGALTYVTDTEYNATERGRPARAGSARAPGCGGRRSTRRAPAGSAGR